MDKAIYLQLLVSLVIPVIAEIEMEFTRSPESVTAPIGDKVSFKCEVKVPGEKLIWRWRRIDQPEDEWKAIDGVSDKDKISTKHLVEVKPDTPSGLYQCVVSYGSISLASISAKLSIARIEKHNNSSIREITAPVHNTLVLHCKEPVSDPPAVISWWKEDVIKYKNKRTAIETPHGVLVLHNVTEKDSGTYGCTATNEFTNEDVDQEIINLTVQKENSDGKARFLETEEYVGVVNTEGLLTLPVTPNNALRLWCGVVGTPAPRVTWSREGGHVPGKHEHMLNVSPFNVADEGIYSCTSKGLRRTWKVVALRAPVWEGSASSINVTEGGHARVSCGAPAGYPPPQISWLFNAQPINDKGIRTTGSELHIDHVEKKHAGIVQCLACNRLGCAYDAALITVVPMQISNQEYSAEVGKRMTFPPVQQKRHNRKNYRKNKDMFPPSRPNVTRMSDTSVMVSWSNSNHGMPIHLFKVQYREASTNYSNGEWHTLNDDIPPHVLSYEVDGLKPDRYYKFRIAGIYENNDNKQGKSSVRFYLQRGGASLRTPRAPRLTAAVAISTHQIQLNWTWSSEGGVEAEGFYVYWRVVTSAGPYEKVTAPGGVRARGIVLGHLLPDTSYELKVQAYTAQAPSDINAANILSVKTQRLANATELIKDRGRVVGSAAGGEAPVAPGALVTAGGAVGAAAILLVLAATLVLCRRAKRPHVAKEKVSAQEGGGNNGYISAKVPITITSNPIHAESGDGSVEMSFIHNNNCGNPGSNDDTLPRSRKSSLSTPQYV